MKCTQHNKLDTGGQDIQLSTLTMARKIKDLICL